MRLDPIDRLPFPEVNAWQFDATVNEPHNMEKILKPNDVIQNLERQKFITWNRTCKIVPLPGCLVMIAIVTISLALEILCSPHTWIYLTLLVIVIPLPIGAPLGFCVSYLVYRYVHEATARRHQAFIDTVYALPDEKLNEDVLKKILLRADDTTLSWIIPKMDFDQLKVAYKILKKRKFKKIFLQNPDNTNPHRAWLNLLRLMNSSDITHSFETQCRLYHEMHVFKTFMPGYSEIALKALRDSNHPFQLQFTKLLMPIENFAIQERNIPIELKEKEGKVTTVSVSNDVILKYSSFMESALEGLAQGEKLELDVEDAEAFIELISLLEGKAEEKMYTRNMLKRIFICANKYMDRFADALRIGLSDRQLRQMLPPNIGLKKYLEKRKILEAES